MNDEYRQHPDYDEAPLRRIMDEYAAAEGEALWQAFEQAQRDGTAPEMPQELDEKCRKLIHDAGRKRCKISFRNCCGIGLKRVAVFALIFLCLCSSAVVSVDAVRLPVLNYFVKDKDRYSSISFKMDSAQEMTLLEHVLSLPSPENCQLVSEERKTDGAFTLKYEGPNGNYVRVGFYYAEGMISYDTEDVEQIPMKINSHDAIYVPKKGQHVLWFDSRHGGIFDVRSEGLEETAFWKYVYCLAE